MVRRFEPFDFERIPLSKSGVLSYRQCPKRFWYMVIKKMKGEELEALVVGTKFHDDVEKLYDKIDRKAILSGERTVTEEYAEHLPEDAHYTHFIEIEQARFDAVKEETGEVTEEFFPLYRELYLYDPEYEYYGTIDRVDKVGDEYALFDYKNSKKPP